MKRQTSSFGLTSVPFLLLMALASVAPNRALAQGTTTTLAITGDQAPGTPAGALFSSFVGYPPVLNDMGQTAYRGSLQAGSGGVDTSNETGIWRNQTLIAREGSQAPGTPTGALFSFFGNPVLNDAGQTAYSGFLLSGSGGVDSTNDNGIWRDQTLIAREGFQAGGAPFGALFSSFGGSVLNNVGQTAYHGILQTGSGGVISTNDSGIWRDQTLIVREGSQAPGTPSGALFSSFGSPVLNDAGQTTYAGILQTGSGGVDSSNDRGIWLDQTLVARESSQAGGTPIGALFSFFGVPVLNDAGQTAYVAFLHAGSGGVDSSNDYGIWRDQTLIAREGLQAPGTPAGALFSSFDDPVLNDAGQTAYLGALQIGVGGVDWSNELGIWITGTNTQSLLVAREGDSLAGRTISSLSFSSSSGGSDGRSRGLNNFSQLAYKAIFTNDDEGVFLFTPEIHWTSAATGSWDNASNWTIGQLPGDPHDVFIDPAVSLTVSGPTGSATMTNLTVGGNSGIATLDLNGGTINASNAMVITSTGVLTGNGVINGNVTNNGTVAADNVTVTGDMLFGPTSLLSIDLGGTIAGTEYDQLLIGGTATLDGSLLIDLTDGFRPTVGDEFEILTYSVFEGLFDDVQFAGALDGMLDYGTSSLTLTITAVPEPSTILLCVGLSMFGLLARKGRA